jgi:hypothetical protein
LSIIERQFPLTCTIQGRDFLDVRANLPLKRVKEEQQVRLVREMQVTVYFDAFAILPQHESSPLKVNGNGNKFRLMTLHNNL